MAAHPCSKNHKRPCLLVVDDDREIRDLLSPLLTRSGYKVITAADERSMQEALVSWHVDLVILDVMLPGTDGFSICRNLRVTAAHLPIIMLTARGDPTDRIVGLEIGADDYIPKPFDVRELEARVRAVLRRTLHPTLGESSSSIFHFAEWTLDARQRELRDPDGTLVDLTSGEFDLLLVFVERAQTPLTRDQLLDLTGAHIAGLYDRSIDVKISRLRRKMERDAATPEFIKTARGIGYQFTQAVTRR